MTLMELALYYNSFLSIGRGLLLLLFPSKLLSVTSKLNQNLMDERQFIAYRIAGLWVFLAGIVCAYAAYDMEYKYIQLTCFAMMCCQAIETVIKRIGKPSDGIGHLMMNAHLAVILALVLVI